ncbi:receptor-like protein 12 [Vigna radiata var. radiata]|uniref:Receptor-like protein 12 n=1 Tax=Vigna radiata var. radiata TaxID=3916 RepID=A0A3Q0EWH2_VIGRR|nr:receptor-like protein 12 [Vigna radiata var. radiata]
MITPTTTSMTKSVRFRLMIFMLFMVSQVVHGEQQIRCLPKEREALLQFKAAVVDRYGMLSSWTIPDCCQWQGIRCSNLTAHILSLDLPGEYPNFIQTGYISGSIHESLIELPQLEYLNLSSNGFGYKKIPEFFGSIRNLKYLDLSSCQFGGEIPSQLGYLSHLKYLNLAWNDLEGSIPRQFGNLSQLQHLDLRNNMFFLNIPSQLGNLTKLEQLCLGCTFGEGMKIEDGGQWLSNLLSLTHLCLDYVSNLNTSHTLLQVIAKLPELRKLSLAACSLSDHFILSSKHSKFNFSTSLSVLDLSDNTFTSPMVFQWVSNITSNLVELHLSNNHLEGSISSHFDMLMHSLRHLDLSYNNLEWASNITSNLVELDLSQNHLEGSTSSDFGLRMNSLRHLDLSGNNFKARDLKSFINICTLHSLYLSSNNLTEDLPSILGNLSSRGSVRHSLQELDLSWNHITGTLSDISLFSSLKSLFLNENQLSGRIHEGVKLPSTLEDFSINSNSLEGGIPKSFGNACALLSLDMSNNNLSGELPTIISHLSGCARYSLQEVYLYMNQINGTLPDFSTFTSLQILDLSENKLNGEISKDIQFSPELEKLCISSNSLKGVLTDYHFANMSKLHDLDLSDNSLALTFTENWVSSFQLFTIKLRSCKLGPTFPKWLQAQNNFFYIDISTAAISDIVPKWFWAKLSVQQVKTMNISYNNLRDCWRQLNSLVYLDLSHNKFSGKIPMSMGSLLDLQALLLRNNNLVGGIPLSLRNCTELVMLDISENKLSGSIPDWIGTKENLKILSLGKNQFSGSLPIEVCCLINIQVFDLSINNLSGKIPKCIKNFTSMVQTTSSIYGGRHSYFYKYGVVETVGTYNLKELLTWKGLDQMFMNNGLSLLKMIDFSSNHFSEEIPIEIEKLSGLISLNLSRNNLIGKIPSNIGNITSLDSLDLSRNQLVGSIPLSLAQIYGLGVLDLSHNHLSGEIPKGTQLQSFNKSSYEDNLDLCGPPLEKCIEDGSAQEPNVEVEEDEYSFFNNDFFISMAIGFTLSFWMVFGSILFKRSWRHSYFNFLNKLTDNIHVKVAIFRKKYLWPLKNDSLA